MNVINIPLELIDEDHDQPRFNFNESSLIELAESIKEIGLLNPIKVRELTNGRYKIIFGNRRFKACQKLKFTEIPCILSNNESEVDIYLEQLTENIQRENFTPVEEALAFKKILSEAKWNISKKYLSNKLGKSESHISKKLDLLTFGESVRQLIHAGNDIKQGSLSEEQVLKLKRVSIEYRDPLALKIAEEPINASDVKKIAELFIDKDRRSEVKEKLIKLTCSDLIQVWNENEIAKLKSNDHFKYPPTLVNKESYETNEKSDKVVEDFIYGKSPIEERLDFLIGRIPSFHPLHSDIFFTIDQMSLEKRRELVNTIEIFIENIELHLKEWKNIKKTIETKTHVKNNIKLIK